MSDNRFQSVSVDPPVSLGPAIVTRLDRDSSNPHQVDLALSVGDKREAGFVSVRPWRMRGKEAGTFIIFVDSLLYEVKIPDAQLVIAGQQLLSVIRRHGWDKEPAQSS